MIIRDCIHSTPSKLSPKLVTLAIQNPQNYFKIKLGGLHLTGVLTPKQNQNAFTPLTVVYLKLNFWLG